MDIAAIQQFMQKVSALAARPQVLHIPERNYRLFKSLHLAGQHAARFRAAGANWRRVKRERNKEFRRLMRAPVSHGSRPSPESVSEAQNRP